MTEQTDVASEAAPMAETAPVEIANSVVQGDFSVDALVDMIHHDPLAEPPAEETPLAASADGGEEQTAEAVPAPVEPAPMGEQVTPSEQVAVEAQVPPATVSPEDLQAAVAAGVRQATAEPEGDATNTEPNFANVNIPPQVLQAMEHEDASVRAQGYQAFAGGIGQLVYAQAMERMAEMAAQMQSQFPQYVQQQQQQQAEQNHVEQDFYGNFPQYNKAELKPIVLQVAMQEQQRLGSTAWTPELRNAVGAKMAALLQTTTAEPTVPAAAAVPPVVPAQLTPQSKGPRPSAHKMPATEDPQSLFYGVR